MNRESELLARVLGSRTFMQGVALRREIEELLAQPEQSEQEPVAWCQMVEGKVQDLLTSFEMKDWIKDDSWAPLYTSPLTPKPLSEDGIQQLINAKHFDTSYTLQQSDKVNLKWYKQGVKDAETHHKIGVDNV